MSILDEIARRRRASALRRLGPAPGTLPARFPMPGLPPPPFVGAEPVTAVPVPVPVPVATLAELLPHALASLPPEARNPPPRPVAPGTGPRGDGPAVAARPVAPAVATAPVSPAVARRPDVPAPVAAPAAPREPPRYETWLPDPDLFKLVSVPVTSTELEPVTSTDLVAVSPSGVVAPMAPSAPAPRTQRHARVLPGTAERARLRRRIRYLRSLRELQLRDLGGFALELHRFGREQPELVRAKLESAAQTDRELRQLESALSGHVELREVREAGIGGACSHCGTVYGSDDRFCSSCGEPLPGMGGEPLPGMGGEAMSGMGGEAMSRAGGEPPGHAGAVDVERTDGHP